MQKTPLRVLIVEDNPADAFLLERLLRPSYTVTHERVETEADFRQALATSEWDIILCDYALPSFTAMRALRIAQENGDMPFIVVTGTLTDDSAVGLMDAGAHDYIFKDNLRRLLPIIAREMRGVRIRTSERQVTQDLKTAIVALRVSHDALVSGQDEFITAIGRALELRDHDTGGHTQRVTWMTVRLARLLGVANGDLDDVRQGALLHDIGKMGIPDSILLKPGPLTDAEWVVMRKHPVFAYELIAPISSMRGLLPIMHHHHEWWDGTGYPSHLRGLAIPLSARMFAVVDVWDAMRSDRPYHKGMPEIDVLAHILALAGTHFDPAIAKKFVANIDALRD